MENLGNSSKYGILLTPDIKLHRKYFNEMVKLIGIQVVYMAPLPGKHYTRYTEIESNYQKPEVVGCIFDEHPTQKTLKKMGWVSELQESASMIHVPFDLHDIQRGALFIVPSGLDNAKGRLFRVNEMQTGMVYPASISCEIVPEYEDTFADNKYDYSRSDFNVLAEEDEDCQ